MSVKRKKKVKFTSCTDILHGNIYLVIIICHLLSIADLKIKKSPILCIKILPSKLNATN